MIRHYPSIAALCDVYEAKSRAESAGNAWYNDESRATTIARTRNGDTALVPDAEAILAQLNTDISVPRCTWERAPAGAFCAVPDVLAGLPTPMRRLAHTMDERAPITILATTTSSAGVDAKTLAKRGTVILALVLALSRLRPVVLRQLTALDGKDNGETIITADINTTPLDLATACYVLTSAGFARRVTYGVAEYINDFTGGWPRSYRYGSPAQYFARLVPRLGLDPRHTLVIGSAEKHDQLLTQPVAWVNSQIAQFTQEQEQE